MASKLVLIAIFVLNAIAFGLAVAAERRKNTGKIGRVKNTDYSFCTYESDIATRFGVGACFSLLASQVLVMAATRCFCFGKSSNPNGSRIWAIILFIVCWLSFLTAEACLMAGSVKNAYHEKRSANAQDPPLSCETLRKGVFAIAAAFIVFTFIISELYYFFHSKARGTNQANGGGEAGVGMGTYK